jgi:transposase
MQIRVGIPDEVDMETREYIRMRASHKRALKKVKQQILAFCLRCGKKYEGTNYWTEAHDGEAIGQGRQGHSLLR